MPRAALVPLLLVATVVSAGPGSAIINPFDNDAGSGGDAGLFVLKLSPGAYEGTLTPPVDSIDSYVFEAEEGTVLTFAINGADAGFYRPPETYPAIQASEFFVLSGNEGQFLIPVGGDWRLEVTSQGGFGGQEYALAFSLARPAGLARATATDGWQVMELRWDSPARLGFYGRVDVGPDAGASPVAMIGMELYDESGMLIGDFFWHTAWLGVGDSLSVGSLVQERVSLPTIIHDASASGWIWLSWNVRSGPGTARLLAYQAQPGKVSLTGFANVDLEARTAHGGGVVRNGMEDFDTGLEVQTPAVGLSDGEQWTASLASRVYGLFDPHGQPGWSESPVGERRDGLRFLLDDVPGVWTFNVSGPFVAGPVPWLGPPFPEVPWTQPVFLDAAAIPALGLAP